MNNKENEINDFIKELEVECVKELEIQHKDLVKICTELEKSRDYYAGLFELAPMGYVTLSTNDTIVEINSMAAKLLGQSELWKLRNQHFTKYIERSDKMLWNHRFISSKKQIGKQHSQLMLQRADGTMFKVRLDYVWGFEAENKLPLLHVTILNIGV